MQWEIHGLINCSVGTNAEKRESSPTSSLDRHPAASRRPSGCCCGENSALHDCHILIWIYLLTDRGSCCIWHPINACSSLFQCSEQLYFQLAWKYIWFLSASPAVVSMFCVIFFPMLSYHHAHKNINSIVRKFLIKASSGYPYIFLSIWQITSLNGQSYRC